MKTISVSDNLHRYIMNHKDAAHKSAEAVIYGLIGENDELKNGIEKMKPLIEDGLNTDGAHHKQEYLEDISKIIKELKK